MPQFLKWDVQHAIERAALSEFSARGVSGATIGGIARAAGVSTGNVYRYYESKDALFDAVIPPEFVAEFRALMRRRVLAYRRGALREPDGAYALASEELLDFCIEHRLRVVTLLLHGQGSPHSGLLDRLVGDLVALAEAHFQVRSAGSRLPADLRDQLAMIYRAYVLGLAQVLARFDGRATIRRYAERYAVYHIAGLEALLQSLLPD